MDRHCEWNLDWHFVANNWLIRTSCVTVNGFVRYDRLRIGSKKAAAWGPIATHGYLDTCLFVILEIEEISFVRGNLLN